MLVLGLGFPSRTHLVKALQQAVDIAGLRRVNQPSERHRLFRRESLGETKVQEHWHRRVLLLYAARSRHKDVPRVRICVEDAGDVQLRRPRLAHALQQ